MEECTKFGLIGKGISYSFSKRYFEKKFSKYSLFGCSYEIYDIESVEDVREIFSQNIRGLNVTIPYKEKIIPLLDELDDEARKIGAVNTIKIDKFGKKTGYNTDVFGFERTLLLHRKDYHDSAFILGDGGAAKAVKYVFEKHNIPYNTISRKSERNFKNISETETKKIKIIVQCTPVGTFPRVEECLNFPFHCLDEKHLVIDLIYNPECTRFMENAEKNRAKTVNGYYMLCQQAEKAWQIWNT